MSQSQNSIVSVSIIIPVYNTLEWLDECLESVVNQTFSDFEVLLINDGSTDGSEVKCKEWAEHDKRIRLLSKKNEGPSKARNLGILMARGEYLAFLDADDWIDVQYLEKMYQKITDTNADMVECDVFRVNNETGEKTYRVCSGMMGRSYTLEEHMKYGYTAIWKCMFRKELFDKWNIRFPDCHSEARAVYALLLAVSSRTENIPEALYYYRRFRKNSLTAKPRSNHGDENAIGIQALDNLLEGFKRCDLLENYNKLLQEIVKIKLSDLLAGVFYRREKEAFRSLTEKYYSFIADKFSDTPSYRYITLGGYNLNRILFNMNLLHDPYCRFNFTSIISLMNPTDGKLVCKHKNRYREMMLEREIKNEFWNILDEIKPDYLFLDFIEERFDLVEVNGGYLTKSDAFDGSEITLEIVRVMQRDLEECMKLWKESCRKFVKKLQLQYPQMQIVLIKSYLSEKVGDIHSQLFFENLEQIQRTNKILKEYYSFFASVCPAAKLVEVLECEYYFTDRQHEYGAIPNHLNEIVNGEIAKKVEGVIGL